MKRVLSGFLILWITSGCAHTQYQQLSCEEECAANGMVCAGQTYGRSMGMGFYGGRVSPMAMGVSREVSCERPKDSKEEKLVDQYREPASAKIEENMKVEQTQKTTLIVVYSVLLAALIGVSAWGIAAVNARR